jgi:hypothetical protein
VDYAESASPGGNRVQTSHIVEFSSRLGEAKIPVPIFTKAKNETGSERSDADLIRAVVEKKQRNPTWGCSHIADQVNLAFGTPNNNKDVAKSDSGSVLRTDAS